MPSWDELRRQTLAGLIREIGGADPNSVATGDIAREVLSVVREPFYDDEPWATSIVWSSAYVGVRQSVYRTYHGKRTRAHRASTGETLYVPAYVNVTTPKNGTPASYRLELWADLPWYKLGRWLEEMLRQRLILDRDIDVFTRVLQLRLQFPESETPREACEMAGIDPNDFDLEKDLTG